MSPESKVNMSRWAFNVIGSFIMILLTVIAFFLGNLITDLKTSVDALTKTVTVLSTKLEGQETAVNKTLTLHSEQLLDHEKRISKGGL
jgi:hypothetical protein